MAQSVQARRWCRPQLLEMGSNIYLVHTSYHEKIPREKPQGRVQIEGAGYSVRVTRSRRLRTIGLSEQPSLRPGLTRKHGFNIYG